MHRVTFPETQVLTPAEIDDPENNSADNPDNHPEIDSEQHLPSTSQEDGITNVDSHQDPEVAAPAQSHPMATRGKDGIRKPNLRYALLTSRSDREIPIEPATVAAALKHLGWTNAMGEELGNFHETKTFTLVPLTA